MATALGGTSGTANIVVWGLRDTQKALKAVAPDVAKAFYARIKSPIAAVAGEAQSLLPSVTGAARGGISVRKGGSARARFGYRIVQSDPGGALIEFANVGRSAQGASLVTTLSDRYGPPGRFLWQAYDKNSSRIFQEVNGAVHDVERHLQQLCDRANDKGW